LPGVTEYTFHKLLCYLYTDEIPRVSSEKCLNLLELANRLCLPRLLNLIEVRVIEDLTKISQNETSEAVELCLRLLEPVKVRDSVILFKFQILLRISLFSCTMHINLLNGACHIYV
jgi:Rho-related BTB domain-containing protein 1/2